MRKPMAATRLRVGEAPGRCLGGGQPRNWLSS